jgi:hypothetical protein
LEKTRALLHQSKLPKNLWGEAIHHAVWLKNRTSTRALPDGKTPYELLNKGTKLDGRAGIGRWLGFDEESNAHRIYWPERRSVSVERSIRFESNDVVVSRMPVVTVPIQGENEQKPKEEA